MFGNGFYNPYMYQPYYQAANMARNLGGLAGASSIGRAGSTIGSAMGNGITNSLGKGLLSKFSFSGLLNGASKTLNVVNQAIPIFYQMRPMINNAKTMFRIMGAVKDDDSTKKSVNGEIRNSNTTFTKSNNTEQKSTKNIINMEHESPTDNPIFFI